MSRMAEGISSALMSRRDLLARTGSQGAPSVAVQEIKHQADNQPGPEPFPRLCGRTTMMKKQAAGESRDTNQTKGTRNGRGRKGTGIPKTKDPKPTRVEAASGAVVG